MSSQNQEFFNLLKSIANEQVFDLELSNGSFVKCKQLSTAQLKELIKTVVDSPVTQIEFNTTATKIFKQSINLENNYTPNIVDRTLFLIETRIQAISPKMTVNNEGKEIVIDFNKIKQNFKEQLNINKNLFEQSQSSEGSIVLTYGPPTLSVEEQLNEEIYSTMVVNADDPEDLRKLIGNVFMYEIAKALKTIKIQDVLLDLSSVSFKDRLKAIETIPASTIQKVIEYIEKQKRAIDQCLTFDDYTIPIDGTLFSLR